MLKPVWRHKDFYSQIADFAYRFFTEISRVQQNILRRLSNIRYDLVNHRLYLFFIIGLLRYGCCHYYLGLAVNRSLNR